MYVAVAAAAGGLEESPVHVQWMSCAEFMEHPLFDVLKHWMRGVSDVASTDLMIEHAALPEMMSPEAVDAANKDAMRTATRRRAAMEVAMPQLSTRYERVGLIAHGAQRLVIPVYLATKTPADFQAVSQFFERGLSWRLREHRIRAVLKRWDSNTILDPPGLIFVLGDPSMVSTPSLAVIAMPETTNEVELGSAIDALESSELVIRALLPQAPFSDSAAPKVLTFSGPEGYYTTIWV